MSQTHISLKVNETREKMAKRSDVYVCIRKRKQKKRGEGKDRVGTGCMEAKNLAFRAFALVSAQKGPQLREKETKEKKNRDVPSHRT